MMATTFNYQGIAYIIGGTLMFALSASHCVTFSWIGNSRIPEIFDSVKQFAKYPMTIFPSVARGITTFIVPVAMVAFVPAASLLGQTEPWFYWALIPCVAFTAVGFLLYHKMNKLYESAGG